MRIAEAFKDVFLEFLETRFGVTLKSHDMPDEYGRCWDGSRIIILYALDKNKRGNFYTLFSGDTRWLNQVSTSFEEMIVEAEKEQTKEEKE